MSNLYYIIITLAITATVSCFSAIKLPHYKAETENEKSLKYYLVFMFCLFYIMLYYWVFPKHSVGVFLVYFFCALDMIDNCSNFVYNLIYGKHHKQKAKRKVK